jgi:hypothetical protein
MAVERQPHAHACAHVHELAPGHAYARVQCFLLRAQVGSMG